MCITFMAILAICIHLSGTIAFHVLAPPEENTYAKLYALIKW